MFLGVSFVPLFIGLFIGEPEIGAVGGLTLFLYISLESQSTIVLGISVFILTLMSMWIGLRAFEGVGVSTGG